MSSLRTRFGWPWAALAVACALAVHARAEERRFLQTRVSPPPATPLLERLPASTPLRLAIELPLRNRDDLAQLLRDLADPQSPRYRQFLTVGQFTERFAPTAADYERVADFARAHGFEVVAATPNRLVLDVRGPARQVESAFGVRMGVYQHPTENRTFFAPNVEPSVEPGLPIRSIAGLTDRERPHPMSAQPSTTPGPMSLALLHGSGPQGSYLGSDMRRAYAPGVTLDGTGQAVALFQLGPFNVRDTYRYFSRTGEPLRVPIVAVLLDGVDGGEPDGGDDGEQSLDIQEAISMAPGLASLIVYESYGENGGELDIWNRIATDNAARQISCSWGYALPDPNDDPVFLEFAAQGQNVLQASGDFGAYSQSVRMDFPMDNANVVVVGGTRLELNPQGVWSSESAWPNSGGGISGSRIPLPAYQQGVANAENQGSSKLRNIPDVAAEADFDNFVCSNGGCFGGWGGTSIAAPRWAGFVALVNQQANGAAVGFLNPELYPLAETASYVGLFHDITAGDNTNKGSPDLFSAVTGYDLVTGWGSPRGQSLIDALAPVQSGPNFALSAEPPFAALSPGQSLTFTVALQASGDPGVVDLSAEIVGTAPGVTASLSATTLVGSSTADLTVTAGASVPGTTFQVMVMGTSGPLTHAAYVTLGPESFFLRSPHRVFVEQAASASIAVAVNPVNGFDRPVAVSLDAALGNGVAAAFSAPEAQPADPPLALTFTAAPFAATGLFSLTLQGDAGDSTDAVPLVLGVSAARGDGGQGLPVDLSAAYNTVHIGTDGKAFSRRGGPRNDGYAYSANLLTPARILDGVQFYFGPPDDLDAVACTGQTLALPQGPFTQLWILATGINGAQRDQNLILDYTDRTGVVLTQSFSDWDFPGENDAGEMEAVAMDYRTIGNGTLDGYYIQNLYAYRFPVDPKKTVQGLTLPQNPNLILHAITLTGPGAALVAHIDDGGLELDAGVEAAPRGCVCSAGSGDTALVGLLGLALALRRRARRG